MSFVSIEFLFFIIISLIIYYLLPKKTQWIVLLVVSYLFFLSGGLRTVSYLLFTTMVTYLVGRYLSYCNELNEIAKENGYKLLSRKLKIEKRQIISLGIVANFGVLFFLKYYEYILGSISEIMNSEKLSAVNIILPIGISFYMFQSVGYIIDIYRNKYKAEKNFGKFALFVSFFPQIIQGPISRFADLSHQLFRENKFSFDNMKDGLQLAMWGYFKKLIIADRLTVVVNLVFNEYQSYGGAIILMGVILYCIQLYCDFSGGIDIARGIAKLFGVDVVENFRRPIFATSLADFWRRWHITLGSWMKDYLFYPLALSKPFIKLGKFTRSVVKGKLGQIIPVSIATFIVYFVIGIWHGSGFKFIAFGIWNAVIITVSLLLEPVYLKIKSKLKIKDTSKAFYIFQLFRTSLIVVIGRYITRAAEFGDAIEMLKITFTNFAIGELFNGTLLNMGLTGYDFLVVLVGTLIVVIVEAFAEKGKSLREGLDKKGFAMQSAVLVIYMVVMLVFGLCRGGYISSEFIYSRF